MIKRDSTRYANLEKLALGAVLAMEASDAESEASITRAYVLQHLRDTDMHAKNAHELWLWAKDGIAKGLPVSMPFAPTHLMMYANQCVQMWESVYGDDKNIKRTCDEMARVSDVHLAYEKAREFFANLNTVDDVESAHVVQSLRDIADCVAQQHPEVIEDVISMGDALHSYMSLWGKLSPRMCMGIACVDEGFRGFRAPNVVLIAGRTNTGKSAIWIPTAIENAKRGKRVLVCSTEMDRNAMTKRMLSHIGGIKLSSLDDIEDGDTEAGILCEERIKKAHSTLHSLPIVMNDKCRTIGEVDELCKQAESNGNPYALIVIDYIQLLKPTKTFINKGEMPISLVSGEMKELAKARNVAILGLSQLSRAAMSEGAEPELHHLAQSGSLENDADMVMLMWRPERSDPTHVELILAKNRHGGYGRWQLTFQGDTMTYYERMPG